MYDVLIRNGRIIDGTGSPWFVSDIAVKDSCIVCIGHLPGSEAATIIDARGHYVSPGFIDMHSHSDLPLLLDGRASSSLAQGITTQAIGNCGISAAPTRNREIYFGPLDSTMVRGLECDWVTFGEYFDRLERQGAGTNVVGLVGHGNIRVAAMGYDNRKPTPEEMKRMKHLMAQAMEDGAAGFSSGLSYVPGPYAELEEFIELGRVVGQYGGIYTSHIRNQTEGIAEAVNEVIAVGKASGITVHVSHMQPADPMIGETSKLLATMDQVRAKGVDISCDAIPYTIGSTALKALLPPWALVGGDEALLDRLRDGESRRKIMEDTLTYGAESGGSRKRNLAKEGQWERIWLGSASRNISLIGKNFAEIGEIRNQSSHEAMLDILLEEEARPWMLAQDVTEEDFCNIIRHPIGGVISDGFSLVPEGVLAEGKHHPRSYGAFPYFLQHFVREQGTITWEQAIHKLTGYVANRIRLQNRGLLREGFRADILVFDPKTIAAVADFENPYQYPKGIEWVLVNGEAAVREGKLTDRMAGQVLRNR